MNTHRSLENSFATVSVSKDLYFHYKKIVKDHSLKNTLEVSQQDFFAFIELNKKENVCYMLIN